MQLLLALMLPVEKAAMLAASNNGVPRLGVPPQRYGEALHGVLSGCGAAAPPTVDGFVSSGCPTSFPTGLALGSSFNRTLWRAVGATIGTEARALFNQGGIAQTSLFTPDLNPFRDCRWGRGMEVPSEDPVHAAEYAAAYIGGFQGEEGGFLRAVAMPKHFQGFVTLRPNTVTDPARNLDHNPLLPLPRNAPKSYDQEGNFGAHDRSSFCANITLQSAVSYHMPPFYAALTRGRAGGLMCSTNGYGINGAPGQASCAHADFNNGVLRDQWGADFSMVTDGNGVGDLYMHYGHGALNCGDGATGPTNAVRVGLRGGVDVELGETLNNYALAAVADGNITMADIDLALSRTLRWLFRLGLMDPRASVPAAALGPADVDTASARALAREAATQAVVLLRNNASSATGAQLVPLDVARVRSVAVVGPNADAWETMLANYHGVNTVAAAHSPFAALATALAGRANVTMASGCANVLCEDASGFAAAVAVASAADVVVLVCGGAPWRGGPGAFNATEGEEYDRTNVTLPGLQEAFIFAVLGTGRPVVLVIERGGPIALSPALLADARLTTILSVCYPGEMGGDGLADVLLGAAAPSGRLPTTSYDGDFVNSRSIIDYNFSSGDGVTHLWYTGTPQWPFGFGLSTTTWALEWLDAGADADAAVDAAELATSPRPYGVNVSNTGTRASDISVLGFVSSGVPGEPLQRLFDFQRAAAVAPGETRTLIFSLPPDAAARVGHDGAVTLHAGALRVFIGAPGEMMLEARLTVEGGAVVRGALFR